MLRCTVAGLMPLMLSEKYGARAGELFDGNRKLFNDIVRHRSYYILRGLPPVIAGELLEPEVPELVERQGKTGMWRGKDAERVSYDILTALSHARLLDGLLAGGGLASPLEALRGQLSYYPVLIRRDIFGQSDDRDSAWLQAFAAEIAERRSGDGSWGGTVVETVYNTERLLSAGKTRADEAVKAGAGYLLGNYRETLPGLHTDGPYGFVASSMFTSGDREREFAAAERLCPQWIPRAVCFRHLAVIQNSACLMILLRLGLEREPKVEKALDNLAGIYARFGGFCTSDIKKPILEGRITL